MAASSVFSLSSDIAPEALTASKTSGCWVRTKLKNSDSKASFGNRNIRIRTVVDCPKGQSHFSRIQRTELFLFHQFGYDFAMLQLFARSFIQIGCKLREAANSRYCANAKRIPPPSFLITLVCAAPPTRDTEIPALIAGRIPALKRSVSRKSDRR